MRICLFTETFLPKIGGHEMAVDELARHYLRLGHEVVVLAQHARRRGTPVFSAPYPVRRFAKPLSQVWGIFGLRRTLRRLHREWPFDVIHCFSSYPTGFAALKIRTELGVPVVITSQGGDLAEGSRFSRRPLIMKRIREALSQADAVTALSDYMKSRALAISPECQPHLRKVPNGVNCAAFEQKATKPAALKNTPLDAGNFLLFLGRLHPRKGVDVLIKAFTRVASEQPTLSLVIAGDGKLRGSLTAQAGRSGLTERVHFTGMITGNEKLWLLQNALVMVCPTRTWEGMPVTVLEAFASALPVVGTRVGGIVDLIAHGEDGLLVQPGDAMDLADALQKFLADPAGRESMRVNARTKAAIYDWSAVAAKYLALFTELCAERKR